MHDSVIRSLSWILLSVSDQYLILSALKSQHLVSPVYINNRANLQCAFIQKKQKCSHFTFYMFNHLIKKKESQPASKNGQKLNVPVN